MHNYLVDSGVSSNVIPYSVCKNINGKQIPCASHSIKLNKYDVKVISDLKITLIRLTSNFRVC